MYSGKVHQENQLGHIFFAEEREKKNSLCREETFTNCRTDLQKEFCAGFVKSLVVGFSSGHHYHKSTFSGN